jgi:hypothetical protein
MATIISRRSGPRKEDVAARRLIDSNRATIERLADTFTNGAWSARKAAAASAPQEPQAEGLIISHGRAAPCGPAVPRIRISPNKRVVVMDEETSRQMHFLGEIRRVEGKWRFVLATKENGFFAPVDADIAASLAALDGAPMGAGRDDDTLAAELTALLGYGGATA